MTILELREKRAKAWEAAKAFLDSHRNERGIHFMAMLLKKSKFKSYFILFIFFRSDKINLRFVFRS